MGRSAGVCGINCALCTVGACPKSVLTLPIAYVCNTTRVHITTSLHHALLWMSRKSHSQSETLLGKHLNDSSLSPLEAVSYPLKNHKCVAATFAKNLRITMLVRWPTVCFLVCVRGNEGRRCVVRRQSSGWQTDAKRKQGKDKAPQKIVPLRGRIGRLSVVRCRLHITTTA